MLGTIAQVTMAFLRRLVAHFHPLVRSVRPALRGPVLDRVYYSSEHNFVYYRIPKSANSTVMLTLSHAIHAATPGENGRGAEAKRMAKNDLKIPLASNRRLRECFTFTFVRDPYSRILSAYLDKIAPGHPKFLQSLGLASGNPGFVEFLRRLDSGYLMANIHWAPQVEVIPCAPFNIDCIGKVENLQQDLATVCERIFGTRDLPLVVRTAGVTSAASRLSEYYGPEEKRLVRKLYQRDFELFYPDSD